MDEVEYYHWHYRVLALSREVTFIHDTVNMASAYRAPVSSEDLAQHQADLDTARYLLAEATATLAAEDARRSASVVVANAS